MGYAKRPEPRMLRFRSKELDEWGFAGRGV
jgi:hypothetical protein